MKRYGDNYRFDTWCMDWPRSLKKAIRGEAISMSVKNIIDSFKLREPQYEKLAQWGHFGNNNLWDK